MHYNKLEKKKYNVENGEKKADQLRRYQWGKELKKVKERLNKLEKYSHPPVDWEKKIDNLERKMDELLYLLRNSGIEARRDI
tara:strand:+ start:113 stop:358 length:246 start_codon:yes stop_codon:yes gene_type:complete